MDLRVDTTRPVDLAAVVAWTLLTILAIAIVPSGPIRVILGLPFVLFLPGYALVAALFPERHREYEVVRGEEGEERESVSSGLDPLERTALSFGLSIAVVPLLGLALNFTPWGIRLVPIATTLSLFIVGAAAVAHWRRLRLPPEERFRIAFHIQPPAWRQYSLLDKALTIGLALSVLAAGGALTYVLTTPREGETFTEFYILGPGGMAEDYPTNLTAGETGRLILGVTSHEGGPSEYTIRMVAESGRFETESGNRTFVSTGNQTLQTWNLTLADEENWEENVTLRLDEPGEYRVRFELDKDGASESPYRRLHLYVTVTG